MTHRVALPPRRAVAVCRGDTAPEHGIAHPCSIRVCHPVGLKALKPWYPPLVLPLLVLPGVLHLCLTWAEVSCVPHECVHGVALRCGWHCAMGAPSHRSPWPRAMGGTAAWCPIPVCNGLLCPAVPHTHV